MDISIILLLGVLVFTLNHTLEFLIVKLLIFLRFFKFHAFYWVPQSITFLVSIGLFNRIYYFFNESQAQTVFWVAVTAYLAIWLRSFIHIVINWRKHKLKPSMGRLFTRMMISLVHYGAACFFAMHLNQMRFQGMFSGMNKSSDLNGLAYSFFMIGCVIAAIYFISGLAMVVYASRSPKYKSRLYLGVLSFLGYSLLAVGGVMGGFLLYGPKPLAGIIMIVCGALLLLANVWLSDRENTRIVNGKISYPSEPGPILTTISLCTIIPGVGLMISGLA